MRFRVDATTSLKAEADRLEQFLVGQGVAYSPFDFYELGRWLRGADVRQPTHGITIVVDELVRRGFLVEVPEEEPEPTPEA